MFLLKQKFSVCVYNNVDDIERLNVNQVLLNRVRITHIIYGSS